MCDIQDDEYEDLINTIFDIIRSIKDPEKDATLEELSVVDEKKILITKSKLNKIQVTIEFVPTTPHCSLATLIGLCIQVKLQRQLPFPYKLKIVIKPGSHETAEDVVKQINDKERVAAALENPNLAKIVEDCIAEAY